MSVCLSVLLTKSDNELLWSFLTSKLSYFVQINHEAVLTCLQLKIKKRLVLVANVLEGIQSEEKINEILPCHHRKISYRVACLWTFKIFNLGLALRWPISSFCTSVASIGNNIQLWVSSSCNCLTFIENQKCLTVPPCQHGVLWPLS